MSAIRVNGVRILDYHEISHDNLSQVSIRIYRGQFLCKNKPLDSKEFYEVVVVPKLGLFKSGEPTFRFTLISNQEGLSFDTIENLISYYNGPEPLPSGVITGKEMANAIMNVKLINREMKILSKIKTSVMNLVKKVKEYFKAASVKSVVIDAGKAIWKFFHWHFATIVLGGFASLIVAWESYPFLGWILFIAFIIMLIINLTTKKTGSEATTTAV
jgi:hypothetical protein